MKLRLERTIPETADVRTFCFSMADECAWEAGQYIRLELDTVLGREERWFTISSAPSSQLLSITTRMTGSRFKVALLALKIGEVIDGSGIGGDFIWKDDANRLVFVAIGIGVTPYHSIISERYHAGLPLPCTLMYFTRDHDAPFLAEFNRIADKRPEFLLRHLYDVKPSAEAVLKEASLIANPLLYLSGAEEVVDSLSTGLLTAGVQKGRLIRDWFPGYGSDTY